ncbi:sigma-70 family RNA polymerase sigma factor [Alkalicoccobacillus gibsonii]|uniref:sigma-70 family RNA polymerase sigma factor n=1 Tax=Alkalicoccobacillus gibsonii TaxID=79881 RepID=UPI001932D839|nr:sigma-70 family RNA polymerase sigma factor [Alkalicoccobacillus gibsonii]MBM0064946.1 sigma-70 family RNA polymerase sigma factor [Alkalicoccobacillus gibsonii]
MHELYFMLKSYKEDLKELEAYRKTLQCRPGLPEGLSEGTFVVLTENGKEKREDEIVGNMISDLKYAIEWIETGRRPGAKRDIDRRSVYELTYHMDPVVLENYARAEEPIEEEPVELTEGDKLRIDDALSVLTESEKDVFMMYHVQQLSMEQIAQCRKVKKTSVQNQLERAKKKIKEQTSCSLFAFAV